MPEGGRNPSTAMPADGMRLARPYGAPGSYYEDKVRAE